MDKTALNKRLIAVAVAVVILILAAGLNLALAQTVTPGGVIHVGDEEVASLITGQGEIVSGAAIESVGDLAENAEPVLIDPPAQGAALMANDDQGMFTERLTEAQGKIGYIIELPGQPVLQTYNDPNNLGLDIVTPDKVRLHITGVKDTAMILKSTVSDASTSALKGPSREIGIVTVSLKDYRLIVMDDARQVTNTASAAVKAIRYGTWKNTAAEACVAIDGGQGQKLVVSVPSGTIGGWNPDTPFKKCPGKETGVKGVATGKVKPVRQVKSGSRSALPYIPGQPGIKKVTPRAGVPPAAPTDVIDEWLPQLPFIPELPELPLVNDLVSGADVPAPIDEIAGSDLPEVSQMPEVDLSTDIDVDGNVDIPDGLPGAQVGAKANANGGVTAGSSGGSSSGGANVNASIDVNIGIE